MNNEINHLPVYRLSYIRSKKREKRFMELATSMTVINPADVFLYLGIPTYPEDLDAVPQQSIFTSLKQLPTKRHYHCCGM